MTDKTRWAEITDRMTALGGMYTRMDETKEFLYMSDYELTYFGTNMKLQNVINATGNKGATRVERVAQMLMDSTWQIVVEGSLSKHAAHEIEIFLDDNLAQADEYLLEEYGMPGLKPFICKHICARGPVGTQWASYLEDGEYKIECLPVDMRWTPFVLNKWVAPITFWYKDELEEQLEVYAKRAEKGLGEYFPFKPTGKGEIEVRDWWGTDSNELLINKQLVYKQPNPYKKPPFVIVLPASGFMLRDSGYMAHEAEDVLFLSKKLLKEDNRQLSIEQSMWMDVILPGYERETQNMDAEPAKQVPASGEVDKVPEGERAQRVERGQLSSAAAAARQDIAGMIDEGAPLSPRSYNSPPSGITVATEVELLNQLQKSRLDGLKVFMEQLCRVMIDQFQIIAKDTEVQIGKRGLKRSWSTVKLKDPDKYTISCQLMTRNKRMEIVNESRALALKGTLPDRYIYEYVLMVDDPDGMERAMDIQRARAANPAISLFEMGIKYAEESEDMEDGPDKELKKWESITLIEEGVRIQRQRMMAQMEEPQRDVEGQVINATESRPNAQGLASLPKMLSEGSRARQQQEV